MQNKYVSVKYWANSAKRNTRIWVEKKVQNKNKNAQFYVGACNTEWPNVVKTHETLINSFKNNWESTEWNIILTWHLLSWTKKLVSSELTCIDFFHSKERALILWKLTLLFPYKQLETRPANEIRIKWII